MSTFRASSAVIVVAMAAIASANPVPKKWKAIYAKVNQTIVKNNVHGYMAWMDKSFVNIQDGKRTSYAAYEKMFTDFLKPFSNIKAGAKPTSYRLKGKDIVIDFHYTFSGEFMSNGQKKTLCFYEDGTDTWRKVHGRYLEFVENITKNGLLPAPKSAKA